YQAPPVSGGGIPVQPVFQPAFIPQTPLADPDSYKPGDVVRDWDVYVNETTTGRLMIGAGVNSDAGLVGTFVLEEQNFDIFRPSLRPIDWVNGTAFRGGGQKLRIELMPGTQLQRYSLTFQEPYLFDSPIGLGVNAFFFERQYTSWT